MPVSLELVSTPVVSATPLVEPSTGSGMQVAAQLVVAAPTHASSQWKVQHSGAASQTQLCTAASSQPGASWAAQQPVPCGNPVVDSLAGAVVGIAIVVVLSLPVEVSSVLSVGDFAH